MLSGIHPFISYVYIYISFVYFLSVMNKIDQGLYSYDFPTNRTALYCHHTILLNFGHSFFPTVTRLDADRISVGNMAFPRSHPIPLPEKDAFSCS